MNRLETKRLVLRRWTLDDAEDCFKYSKDERVAGPSGWKAHESVEESRDVIEKYYFEPEVYAVCLKSDPKLRAIGSICITFKKYSPIVELTEDDGEIGYWIGVEHWGNGYATEAAKRIAKHAFQDLKLKKLWGRHYVSNPKSGHILKKLGLEHMYDKEEKDELTGKMEMSSFYCIEREAWRAKNEVM